MQEVLAIVVTYNRKDILKRCIGSLLCSDVPCDILVVDNNSTDGTQECIQELIDKKNIQYHNTGENVGGAGGFCLGIEIAMKKGYPYIWLMDDDTLVQGSTLSELRNADKVLQGNYGFLSSVAYWKDGTLCNMNVQRTDLNKKVQDYEGISPIIMATFVSFFVKAEIVKEIGLPIKEFFIWADDLEYSRRISRAMPCYLVPQSKVEHHMESNKKVGIAEDTNDRLWRYDYLYRNEVYVFRREGIKGYVYLWARLVKHLSLILCNAKEDKFQKMKRVCKSFANGFTFSPSIKYADVNGKEV